LLEEKPPRRSGEATSGVDARDSRWQTFGGITRWNGKRRRSAEFASPCDFQIASELASRAGTSTQAPRPELNRCSWSASNRTRKGGKVRNRGSQSVVRRPGGSCRTLSCYRRSVPITPRIQGITVSNCVVYRRIGRLTDRPDASTRLPVATRNGKIALPHQVLRERPGSS